MTTLAGVLDWETSDQMGTEWRRPAVNVRRARLTGGARSRTKGRAVWDQVLMLQQASPAEAMASQLRALREGDIELPRLGEQTEKRVLQFVNNVCTQVATLPSVAPDGEGVAILHWVAGRESLVVTIEARGATSLWFKSGSEPAISISDEWQIQARARSIVTSFGQRVTSRARVG